MYISILNNNYFLIEFEHFCILKTKLKNFCRSSRNRTYIRNLEGFCPNPLDDRPL